MVSSFQPLSSSNKPKSTSLPSCCLSLENKDIFKKKKGENNSKIKLKKNKLEYNKANK